MTTFAIAMVSAAILALPPPTNAARRLGGLQLTVVDDRQAAPKDDPHAVASTFDLLAACLRAGLPMATAAATVAESSPAPLSMSLRRAADLLALGADAATAWQDASSDPATESLARMARRSARSGSSLAGAMTELALQRRTEAEDAAGAQAERAGVLISGPLGLCFLPAFICLGIVPVVVGLAGHVLGGGGLL